MIKRIINMAASLKTGIALMAAMLVFFVCGAIQMPAMPAYQSMNSIALFNWLIKAPISATWWLWGSVAALSLLAVNTIACSIESVIKKRPLGITRWLLMLSPQIMHIGFLFILLAHLLSSIWSFKATGMLREGDSAMLPDGTVMSIKSVNAKLTPEGYMDDYSVELEYYDEGAYVRRDLSAPNRPSFHKNLGVYVKNVEPGAALIEISREPGATAALIGGILFSIGCMGLIVYKTGREESET